MPYTNYQQQAQELARVAVELLRELGDEDDTIYGEVLCRKLYKSGVYP